ncbi:MAG TPA: TolC family protein [Gammaproteobacteria bacterium]|jgi:outer membrane protein|nr:TolC family protein [Gammaproteobacteria bacterium]
MTEAQHRIARCLLLVLAAAQCAVAAADESLRIDLGTALRLADERNLDVAIYYQRVAAASATLAESRLLAVPTLTVGTDSDRHHGTLQETSGVVDDVDRASRFTGAGATLAVDIAAAIYRPLAARQNLDAVRASATVNRHRVLLEVATAYLALLQAQATVRVADAALERANDLAALTANYAQTGEGLQADAEMAAVQPLLWQQQQLAARANAEAAAAAVASLLHLDRGARLTPVEEAVPSLELYADGQDLDRLIDQALQGRPERDQLDALFAAAENDLKAQRYGLFIPRVGLAYSSGEFGGAPGSGIANTAHRDDLALQLYWQFDAVGLGHRTKVNAREAELRQIGLERDKLHDAIVAEVRTAYAGVQSQRGQLPLTDAAVRHAAEAYELQRERIYDQQGLPLEAQTAMQALAAAELARIDALVGYDLAQIRLHTALGNPLEKVNP